MTDPAKQNGPRQRRRTLQLGLAGAVLAIAAGFAAIALASGSPFVAAATNAKLGEKVLVDSHGRTLYALTPETAGHLLCKSSECLKLWPPLTVPSRSAKLRLGAGVHGRLAVLRRGALLQVTLDGQPLYRFAGDRSSGEAGGQNLKSFGGTWHVLSDAGVPSAKVPAASAPAPSGTTTSTPTTTTTAPGYSSPGW